MNLALDLRKAGVDRKSRKVHGKGTRFVESEKRFAGVSRNDGSVSVRFDAISGHK